MTDPAEMHARIMALPIDKQLHVAADMVATGRLPILRTVEPLLRVIETNLGLAIRAAEKELEAHINEIASRKVPGE